MSGTGWLRRVCGVLGLAATLVSSPVVAWAQAAGQPLIDALRALQARGLRVVFSSATITSEMRVVREPRAGSLREQLDELLGPYGLQARHGPAGILQIVPLDLRTSSSRRPAPAGLPAPGVATSAPHAHHEFVTVSGVIPYRSDLGVASEIRLDRAQIVRMYGDLADDPLRAIQALPRVAAADEFRGEITVRGSALHQAEIVVDGVSARWLQHTAYGRGLTGTVSMFAAPVVDDATLRAGAYPRRHGDRLGPQLDMTIREGSRTRFALRGAVGSMSAAVLGEGPLGARGSGSWLVTARQSLSEWPATIEEDARTAFGFSDALAKVTYDVRLGQQVAVGVLGGSSSVDLEDVLGPNALEDGINRALVVNAAWRTVLDPATVLRQQASVMRHHFLNREQGGRLNDSGANEEIVYRGDVTRALPRGLFEAGGRIERTVMADVPEMTMNSALSAASWQRGGYAHFAWTAAPSLTVSPGIRITSASNLPGVTASRWLLAEWVFASGWSLHGSVGDSAQPPTLRQMAAARPGDRLLPERARYVDLGVEQRVTRELRWQATVFSRHEDDILRGPDAHARLAGGVLVAPEPEYRNVLTGVAHGIELLLDRHAPDGPSGWVAYSFGRTRYWDVERHETFWGDFDQRHALTFVGVSDIGSTARVGVTFRAASNSPVPGYLARDERGLVVASQRNRIRLPPYVRLDLRAEREFSYLGRRLVLNVELANMLNRRNLGLGAGSIDPVGGVASGFTSALLGRRLTGGAVVYF